MDDVPILYNSTSGSVLFLLNHRDFPNYYDFSFVTERPRNKLVPVTAYVIVAVTRLSLTSCSLSLSLFSFLSLNETGRKTQAVMLPKNPEDFPVAGNLQTVTKH